MTGKFSTGINEKVMAMERVEKKKDLGCIMFGKFRGREWNDLPTHYLQFLVSEKCFCNDDVKETARRALQNNGKMDGQILMF